MMKIEERGEGEEVRTYVADQTDRNSSPWNDGILICLSLLTLALISKLVQISPHPFPPVLSLSIYLFREIEILSCLSYLSITLIAMLVIS